MTRPTVFAPALVLALAACAPEMSGPPQPVTAASPVPGGNWVVTDAFPTGTAGFGAGRLVGQPVRLDPAEASEPGGATCPHPSYRRQLAAEAEVLGAPDRAAEFPALARTLTTVTVLCDGREFGRYAIWPDGSLTTRWGDAMLRLERAPAVALHEPPPPQPEAAAAPPEATEPPAVAPTSPPPSPPPAAEKRLYLASYRGAATARAGWAQFIQASPTLAKLKSETVPVDLGKKGRFLRLFALTHGEQEAKRVCVELKRMLPDCGTGP